MSNNHIISFFCTLTIAATSLAAEPKVEVLEYPATLKGTDKTYKVGVLMINTLTTPIEDKKMSKRLEFYTPKQLGDIFFKHKYGSNAFLHEASYNRVAIEGTVVGWLNAPKSGLDAKDIVSNMDSYISLANPHIKYRDYDVFVIHALVDGRGQQTGWLYPKQSFKTPQGQIDKMGIIWMINSAVFDEAPLESSSWSSGDAVLPSTSWAHEFLHTLGITGHSNSYDCGNKTLTTKGEGNPIKGYGGCFSIMGEHAFGTHPDVLMKSRLGWVESDQFPTIKKSGTYDIYPLAAADTGVKGLLIPVSPAIKHDTQSATFDAFVIEYRTPIGFDRYLKRLNGSKFLTTYKPQGDVDSNGVIIYMKYSNPKTDATVLLDMNPETPFGSRGIKHTGNVGKFADAILPINKTFSHQDISITPLGVNKKGAMQVKVELR